MTEQDKSSEIDWSAFYDKIDEMTAETRGQLSYYLDLAYGNHPKQKLDVYLPLGRLGEAPVFLFLHGGGFKEGDRALYGYIAWPFAKHGVITAVASYRFIGEGFHYPDQPEDAREAIAWIYRNIHRYGGNPKQIYMGGHSAGAILSADVGLDRGWLQGRGLPGTLIQGVAAVSGPYDLRPESYEASAEEVEELAAYAPSAELAEQASPLFHINNPAPRAVVAVGSLEEKYLKSSQDLAQKLAAKGSNTRLIVLKGHRHDDMVLSLGRKESGLFQAVLDMIWGQ